MKETKSIRIHTSIRLSDEARHAVAAMKQLPGGFSLAHLIECAIAEEAKKKGIVVTLPFHGKAPRRGRPPKWKG